MSFLFWAFYVLKRTTYCDPLTHLLFYYYFFLNDPFILILSIRPHKSMCRLHLWIAVFLQDKQFPSEKKTQGIKPCMVSIYMVTMNHHIHIMN